MVKNKLPFSREFGNGAVVPLGQVIVKDDFHVVFDALIGFRGLMLSRGLRIGTHFLSPLKNKDVREEKVTKNRAGRPRHIHDPGIQQEPSQMYRYSALSAPLGQTFAPQILPGLLWQAGSLAAWLYP